MEQKVLTIGNLAFLTWGMLHVFFLWVLISTKYFPVCSVELNFLNGTHLVLLNDCGKIEQASNSHFSSWCEFSGGNFSWEKGSVLFWELFNARNQRCVFDVNTELPCILPLCIDINALQVMDGEKNAIT